MLLFALLFFPDRVGSICPTAPYPGVGVTGRAIFGRGGFFGKCFNRRLSRFKCTDTHKNMDHVTDPIQIAPQTAALAKTKVCTAGKGQEAAERVREQEFFLKPLLPQMKKKKKKVSLNGVTANT